MRIVFILISTFIHMSSPKVPLTYKVVRSNFTLDPSLNTVLIHTQKPTPTMSAEVMMKTNVWPSSNEDENWMEILSPDRTSLQLVPKRTKAFTLHMDEEY